MMNKHIVISRIKLVRAFLYSFLFFVCLIANQFYNMSIVSAVIFFIVVGDTLLSLKQNALKYVHLYFVSILSIFSTLLIEYNEIYIGELQIWSFPAHSTTLIALWYALILYTINLKEDKKASIETMLPVGFNSNVKRSKYIDLVIPPLMMVAIYILIMAIRTPFWEVKLSRFVYASQYLNSITLACKNYFVYFYPILLIQIVFNRKSKAISIITLSIYIVACFMIGEKFGVLWRLIIILALVITSTAFNLSKLISNHKIMIVLIGAVIFAAVIINYAILTNDPWNTLLERIAAQGQLWWSTYSKVSRESIHIKEISDEFMFSKPYAIGIYKLMFYNAPEALVNRYISYGIAFSESTAASCYYYFGLPGIIIIAPLIGFGWQFVTGMLYRAIQRATLLDTVLCARLYFSFSALSTNSSFYEFVQPLSCLCYLGIFILYCIRRRKIQYWGIN